MIEEAKCFVGFSNPRVDFGKFSGGLRPLEGVLRLRYQFDRLPAFVNRLFFQTQSSKNGTELHVTTRIVGSITHKSLRHWSGAFERGLRFRLVALIQIKSPFHGSFWAGAGVWVTQCFSPKLLHQLKGIGELPL